MTPPPEKASAESIAKRLDLAKKHREAQVRYKLRHPEAGKNYDRKNAYRTRKKKHPLRRIRMAMYFGMTRRVAGKTDKQYWCGLPRVEKVVFDKWIDSQKWLIKKLLRIQALNGGKYGFAPSLNRIDPNQGYVLGNMEIIPVNVNASLARKPNTLEISRCLTQAEHTAIGRRDSCRRGHEWSIKNIYVRRNGEAECRICKNLMRRIFRAKSSAVIVTAAREG